MQHGATANEVEPAIRLGMNTVGSPHQGRVELGTGTVHPRRLSGDRYSPDRTFTTRTKQARPRNRFPQPPGARTTDLAIRGRDAASVLSVSTLCDSKRCSPPV
jgi:hypothetical protein